MYGERFLESKFSRTEIIFNFFFCNYSVALVAEKHTLFSLV